MKENHSHMAEFPFMKLGLFNIIDATGVTAVDEVIPKVIDGSVRQFQLFGDTTSDGQLVRMFGLELPSWAGVQSFPVGIALQIPNMFNYQRLTNPLTKSENS
jgi:hypothetical protein